MVWLKELHGTYVQEGLLAIFFCLLSAGVAVAESPPNVVLIISDDQAWTDFGFMGHEHIETPNIDRLANESLTYTRGYVPHGVCRPSLATLITGLYPHQHEVVGNDPEKGGDRSYADKRRDLIAKIDPLPKLPDLLKVKDYLSHQSGKWWQGNYRRGGFTHGMTEGFRKNHKGGRHGDKGLKIGRKGLDPIYNFIEESRNRDRPFFLWYAPFMPHTPHNPPKKLLKKYKQRTDSDAIAQYWAMCEWFDQTVGDLLGYIDRNGMRENTIVLFVADNGWIQKPNNKGQYAPRSKRTAYEGGVRTPIMVRWPGQIEPRMDTVTPVSSVDIPPTILDAAGLNVPERMPGISLVNRNRLKERNGTFGATYYHDIRDLNDPVKSLKRRWTIHGRWKLLLPYDENLPDAPVELYDLKNDPHEKNNLADKHPERVRKLKQRIQNWWNISDTD
jgi:uncharacterized sulfatase